MRPAAPVLLLLAGCAGTASPPPHAAPGAAAPAADPAGEPGPADAATPWESIGASVEGRPLRVRRVGRGPRRVLWIGAIHGDEPEGRAATAGIADALAAVPAALDAVTVTLLEDANPDGTARRTRGNARGVDLNRNLPAPGFRPGPRSGAAPLDQPEARALHDLLLAVDPHLVLVHHSWPRRRFVNFDGPAGDLAAAFARRSGYDLRASDRLPPTPGSLGSWAGRALGIPVLTVEHRRGADPAAAWAATRDATLEAVLGGSP